MFAASLGGNLGAEAISRVTTALTGGISAVIDYSSNLEQAQIGFETFTGSAVAARKHLADLEEFAKTTPFEFSGLVNASRKLQGVGKDAEQIIPILTDIGNAAAAAGASSEDINAITRQISRS